jgi:hypothetical protein
MPRLHARRGAVAILTVLLFLALLGIGAVVVDFARMELMRNQLQTAADAAALSGAVQLTRSPKTDYLAQAKAIGQSNPLFDTKVVVPDAAVEVGMWDPGQRLFEENGNNPATANAVRVTLRDTSNYLIANRLGWARKPVAAQAVAWAGPSVGKTDCMKPWAMWYGLLKTKIDTYLNRPIAPDDPLLPSDVDALRQMSEAQRTFTLFLGNNKSDPDAVINSGNFYAVDLPPVTYADGTSGTPLTGGDNYKYALAGMDKSGNPVCYSVGVGDVLQTETGGMLGPTKQGVTGQGGGLPAGGGVCTSMSGNTCLGPDGNSPVIKSAFWTQSTNKGSGKFLVTVNIIGSFTLKEWNDKNASITGVFLPLADNGPVGSKTTTLVKVLLVQ